MIQEFVSNVEKVAKDVMNGIHTAIPGYIEAFDINTGLATVAPSGSFSKPDGTKIPFPPIASVPVLVPQSTSSGAEIAFPIVKGDSCLIIFSEQELDSWRYEAESSYSLKFDITNAIAIPGLGKISGAALKEACSNNSIVIANETTKLSVTKAGVTIQGNLSVQGNISCTGTFPKD